MGKIPTTIRTQLSDVRDCPPWFSRFLSMQNTFNQAIYEVLAGQVTFGENIRVQIKEFNFTTRPDYDTGGWDLISMTNNLKTKAFLMTICQMYATDDSGVITDAPFIDWQDVNGNLVIRYITGLENETPYFLRLMAA